MYSENDNLMNRIDRLTAILIHLQTKRVVKAQELANRFNISLRTVYRDVRALEEAGVPIGAEAGIGYFLEGYQLPPVMFTKSEASALLFGAKFIERWADASVKQEFESALYKIKAVLKRPDQEHLDDLEASVNVHKPKTAPDYTDGFLTDIQQAITRRQVLRFVYFSFYSDQTITREVEPVGLFHYGQAWHLLAFCRLRNDYRDFRVDRITDMTLTGEQFSRKERLSLEEYLNRPNDQPATYEVTLLIHKRVKRFVHETKHFWGLHSEEDDGEYIRMCFRTCQPKGLARWLLSYGDAVQIEYPDSFKYLVQEIVEDLHSHYLKSEVVL